MCRYDLMKDLSRCLQDLSSSSLCITFEYSHKIYAYIFVFGKASRKYMGNCNVTRLLRIHIALAGSEQ